MEDSGGVMFCSDTRTEKMSQLAQNPAAEACWYFEDSREQFRLQGTLLVATAECSDQRLARVRSRIADLMRTSAVACSGVCGVTNRPMCQSLWHGGAEGYASTYSRAAPQAGGVRLPAHVSLQTYCVCTMCIFGI